LQKVVFGCPGKQLLHLLPASGANAPRTLAKAGWVCERKGNIVTTIVKSIFSAGFKKMKVYTFGHRFFTSLFSALSSPIFSLLSLLRQNFLLLLYNFNFQNLEKYGNIPPKF